MTPERRLQRAGWVWMAIAIGTWSITVLTCIAALRVPELRGTAASVLGTLAIGGLSCARPMIRNQGRREISVAVTMLSMGIHRAVSHMLYHM